MIEPGGPFIIFGLGNPGRHFREDRHNIGFMLLDQLAEDFVAAFGKVQFGTLITDVRVDGKKVLLAKPQTFMNRSGESVQSLIRYYRIPHPQTLIIFDDLDLPLGSIRIRPQGGSGGHNGMQSVLDHLETEDLPRMRLGIGRPPGSMDPSNYVLGPFSEEEMVDVVAVIEKAKAAALSFILEGIETAMNRYNFRSEE
jgi:PTH1 family peptidyl-tRNA hydrolase